MNYLNSAINKSTDSLSSGKRINSAADSPSEIIRISRLDAQRRGNIIAQRNIQDGISLCQIGENALSHVNDIGQKLRELAIQYKNDALSKDDKDQISNNAKDLLKEISSVFNDTEFNGEKVFKKNNYSIQSGPDLNETFNMSMFKFKDIENITEVEKPKLVEKTYDISVFTKNIFEKPITGSLSLDLTSDKSSFSINFDNKKYNGIVSFDNKIGKFDLYTEKGCYTGQIELNCASTSKDLVGANKFSLDSAIGYIETGKVSFNFKSSTMKNEKTEIKDIINLSSMDKANISSVLDVGFIDKNILDPVNIGRSSLGISNNILESRFEQQANQENLNTSILSKIKDVDLARELMKKTKNEMLLNTNISLFTDNLEKHRGYIVQLLTR